MNYLYNILDKDLKVKDNFNIGQWVNEISGVKEKVEMKEKLPESKEAFFVFNNKKLNKKYKYTYHKDYEHQEDKCAYLANSLNFLPIQILEIESVRMRNYGNFSARKILDLYTLSPNPVVSIESHEGLISSILIPPNIKIISFLLEKIIM